MKRSLLIMILVTLFPCFCLYAQDPKQSPADEFVHAITSWMEARGETVTLQLAQSLRDVHPVLEAAAGDKRMSKFFWHCVVHGDPKHIKWKEAKEMILKGRILLAVQSHSLRVDLTGVNGQAYWTEEPKLDDVLRAVQSVDTNFVFMGYATE